MNRRLLSFEEVLLECGCNTELVKQFDRLHGTNLSRVGSTLDLMIDDASGRTEADVRAFAAFVLGIVWLPLAERRPEGEDP